MRGIILAACVLVAGCGSGPIGPTPARSDPGATYLRIVKPTNDCLDTLYSHTKVADYPKIRADAAACVQADHQFNGDLLALEDQAPKARNDIEALRKSTAEEERLMSAIAGSTTDINTGVAVLAMNNHNDGGAAALVRSDLGLPALGATPG